jgi:sulfoxide reductase heme-binding subunit YedZ
MTSHDPFTYGWWLASRAAGVVALVLITASVIIGLAMADRLPSPRVRVALRATHERVAIAGLVAIAAHGLLLLPDPWLKPGLAGVLVPFASPYRPGWTGLGVLAGLGSAVLGLSFYARRWVGGGRWRRAHRLTPAVYVLVVAHVLGAGSDAGTAWLRILVLGGAAVVAVLLAERVRASLARPRLARSTE